MGIKITGASLSKGYYYGEYLQHKPGLDCEITGDTTEDEALDMLEDLLDKWHNKKVAPSMDVTNGPASPMIIDRALTDRIEKAIDDATTLEQMDKIKKDNPVFPGKLLTVFNAKRKELSNG